MAFWRSGAEKGGEVQEVRRMQDLEWGGLGWEAEKEEGPRGWQEAPLKGEEMGLRNVPRSNGLPEGSREKNYLLGVRGNVR